MIFIVILVGLHLEICKIHKTLLPPFLSNYFIAPGTSELPVPLDLIPFIEVTKFVSVLVPLEELWKNTTVCPGDNLLTVISAPDYLILFKKYNSSVDLFDYIDSFGLSFECLDFDTLKCVFPLTQVSTSNKQQYILVNLKPNKIKLDILSSQSTLFWLGGCSTHWVLKYKSCWLEIWDKDLYSQDSTSFRRKSIVLFSAFF